MCECLEYEDGEMHLCVVCADEFKLLRAENDRLRAELLETRGALAATVERCENAEARLARIDDLLDVMGRDDDSPVTTEEAVGELLTECKLARESRDEAQMRVARLEEALREIRRRIPAHSQGEFFVEHFGPDGEYLGSEAVNPVDIIACIVGALDAALARGAEPQARKVGEALAACPFCGGAVCRDFVSDEYRSSISCDVCGYDLRVPNKTWNTRVAPPQASEGLGADPFTRVWDNPEDAVYDAMKPEVPVPPQAREVPDAETYGAWKAAALRVGEELAPTGPDGYYDFGPSRWLEWALSRIKPVAPPQALPVSDEDECPCCLTHSCEGFRRYVAQALRPAPPQAREMDALAASWAKNAHRRRAVALGDVCVCLPCETARFLAALARGGGA